MRDDTTFLLKSHSAITIDGPVEFLSTVHAASADLFHASAEYFNFSADGGYESNNAAL